MPHKQQHRSRPWRIGKYTYCYKITRSPFCPSCYVGQCLTGCLFAVGIASLGPSAAKEQPEPGIWACFWRSSAAALTKHACVLQNMGIIMQNMGEAAEAAEAAAGYYQGVDGWWRGKSHGQGGASVGPAAYYSAEGWKMDDFIAAPLILFFFHMSILMLWCTNCVWWSNGVMNESQKQCLYGNWQ